MKRLANSQDDLKTVARKTYSYLTRKGIIGYAFNLDGTVTAQMSGGFMPPRELPAASSAVKEALRETWNRMKPTEDFKTFVQLLKEDSLPFYILTFSDRKSLKKIESYSALQKQRGYFEHHFKKRDLGKEELGMKIEEFKEKCVAGKELVTAVLKKDKISPTNILAWNPRYVINVWCVSL